MKTIQTVFRVNRKMSLIMLLCIMIGITSCSKNDDSVVVLKEEVKLSGENQITSFVFLLINNPIEVNVVATIDEENKTITAVMPPDTNISGLLPEVKISELSTIDNDTAQDFTEPLKYKVTAEDGSTAVYTVTITTLLTQRQILQTILDANPENTLDWDLNNTADLGSLTGVTTDIDGNIIELAQSDKKISLLPSEIGQLVNLERLSLTINQITYFPPELVQLTKLEILNLSNNSLTVLTPEIGQLTRLKKLYLLGNRFTSLPLEIGQLSNLSILELRDNKLSELPREIGQLSSLESLYLSSNDLNSLPAEVWLLSSLRTLVLSDNNLSSIPAEIGQLTGLESLSLNSNQLTSLPTEIKQLVNLKSLDVSNNKLSTFNHVPFIPSVNNSNILDCSTETNLTTLRLSGNPNLTDINKCICDLDIDNGGAVNIDIVPNEVDCVDSNVIGN